MRRSILLLLLLAIGVGTTAGLAFSSPDQSDLIPVTPPAELPALVPNLDALTLADPATDSCDLASELILNEDDVAEGAVTDVSDFTTSVADPAISCMIGTPTSGQGYRTAWHKFVAPADGTLIVSTKTNADYKRNYDTVVSIYQDSSAGACTTLALVACNDDSYGFLSEASATVTAGETYMIQVADRNLAAPGQILLNVEVFFESAGSWDQSNTTQLPQGLSRHSVIINGSDAYIIGGEGTINPRNGTLYKYDIINQTVSTLASFPAGLTPNGSGYANTDAVLVGDQIHLPTGAVGGTTYDATHWVYDISDNAWSTITNPTVSWGSITVTATATTAGVPAYSQFLPYSSGSQNGFYVLGGLVGKFLGSVALDEVHPSDVALRYIDNGSTQTWQTLPRMSKARYAHTGATISNLACVVGGLTTTTTANTLITDGECYDPSSGMWLPNVGALNTPRYNAESAVAPDGQWYVFGGLDASGQPVASVEVHNFNTATWREMPTNYNIDEPALSWMRGGFVDNTMWLFGGEQSNNAPVSLVQAKLFDLSPQNFIATSSVYLPIVGKAPNTSAQDTFTSSTVLTLNSPLSENFDGVGDIYDLYRFVWSGGVATINLTNVPANSDYDLLLYDSNKTLIAVAQSIGQTSETINQSLSSGTYYVMVARSSPPPSFAPTGGPYTIEVSTQ